MSLSDYDDDKIFAVMHLPVETGQFIWRVIERPKGMFQCEKIRVFHKGDSWTSSCIRDEVHTVPELPENLAGNFAILRVGVINKHYDDVGVCIERFSHPYSVVSYIIPDEELPGL